MIPKHIDNPTTEDQLLATISNAVRHREKTGDSTQIDHAIDALGWSEENRYKYFVKATTAEERQKLHESLSYKGAFQSISNMLGSTAGIAGVTAIAEKFSDKGYEKLVDGIHQCITNALVQGKP